MATATLSRPATTSSSRRRPRRRRRWPFVVVLALVVALLGTGGWLLGFSSVLATQAVSVTGTAALANDQVKRAAAVPIGVPLARQNLDAVAHRVAQLPPVESVRVNRRWPDTVAIDVTERRSLIGIRVGTGYALVDRFGVAFLTAPTMPDTVVPAQVPLANAPALVEVGRVAGALPSKLRARISVIKAQSPTTVTIVLDTGVPVIWGTSADSALKSQIVLALLRHDKRYRAIDVTSPHNPAVR